MVERVLRPGMTDYTISYRMQCGYGVVLLLVPYKQEEFPKSTKVKFYLNATIIFRSIGTEKKRVSLKRWRFASLYSLNNGMNTDSFFLL